MVSFSWYGSTVAMFFIPQARPKSSTEAATVWLTHERAPGARVLLVAGHGGGPVVHDDDHRGALVVGDVQEAGDAGVEERGIADHADDLARAEPSCVPAPRLCSATCMPWAIETPAPMQRTVSIRFSGGNTPRE